MPTRRILVVAAHPDDEVLGLGGTLARHADQGDEIHILILAEGATSRQGEGAEAVAHLRQVAARAAAILGARPPRFAGLPDNRMDSLDLLDVTQVVEAVVEEVKPDVVYTHHGGDLNRDHRVTHEAVVTACRPLPGAPRRALFAFETVSSTEWASPAVGEAFRPARFVDISASFDRKMRALAEYACEMRPFPHARSLLAVEALARLRGSQAGLDAAEAFVLLHEVL